MKPSIKYPLRNMCIKIIKPRIRIPKAHILSKSLVKANAISICTQKTSMPQLITAIFYKNHKI